jgi:UDP-glucose 4-epimerase
VFGYGSHLEGYRDGEYQKTGFQKMIDDAEAGNPIEVWGDANAARDMVYVKDVVSAILKAMASKYACGLYNISLGDTLSLQEEAEAIRKEFRPLSCIINLPEKENNIEECLYDVSKARRDFGWFPRYAFADMLKDYKLERESGKHQHLVDGRRMA